MCDPSHDVERVSQRCALESLSTGGLPLGLVERACAGRGTPPGMLVGIGELAALVRMPARDSVRSRRLGMGTATTKGWERCAPLDSSFALCADML
eukprot:NODE_24375_length_627_cov_8.303714.p4 GENE.NODE_24375_length_627_cov_8.303714~~NODE_24375_length_627_cov_8.303714.p4  ORF type:complete len:95 (+),score=12.38 NODE_24375_length_627_cov_8.303714:286-570(+)